MEIGIEENVINIRGPRNVGADQHVPRNKKANLANGHRDDGRGGYTKHEISVWIDNISSMCFTWCVWGD